MIHLAIQLPDGQMVACEFEPQVDEDWVQVVMQPIPTKGNDIIMQIGVLIKQGEEWEHLLIQPIAKNAVASSA